MGYSFEWDPVKEKTNIGKHKITFTEAKSVFLDEFARIFPDHEHSDFEYREIIFGFSDKNRLLIVNFIERNDKIRIISSRKVNSKERALYENNNRHRN